MIYTCIKYPIRGCVYIFLYIDSQLSLNQQYIAFLKILLDYKTVDYKMVQQWTSALA